MFVRVQATSKPGKAKKLRKELERSGTVKGTITIAHTGAEDWRLITELPLDQVIVALYAATKGVIHAQEKMAAGDADVRLTHESDEPMKHVAAGRRRHPEIVANADGSLTAPPGETFIFCAECGAAKWFLTQLEFDLGPFARSVCVSCGNELKFITANPGEGHA